MCRVSTPQDRVVKDSNECPQREMETHRLLQQNGCHRHVMMLIDSFETDLFFCVALEYMSHGDLMHAMLGEKPSDVVARALQNPRKILWQLALALQFMHAQGWAHLDVSMENAMFTGLGDIKLCDFGMAHHLPLNTPPYLPLMAVAKTPYRAPELQSQHQVFHAFKSDVFSFGCIAYMLLTRLRPFKEATRADLNFSKRIDRCDYSDLAMLSDADVGFLKTMLRWEPQRCLIADVLQHPWFQPAVPRSLRLPASAAVESKKEQPVDATTTESVSPKLIRTVTERKEQ